MIDERHFPTSRPEPANDDAVSPSPRRRPLSSVPDGARWGSDRDLPADLVITPSRKLRYPSWKELF